MTSCIINLEALPVSRDPCHYDVMPLGRTPLLIDQTMLCEAARLLQAPEQALDRDDHWWPPSIPERLFHLSTFLDALVLYDQLYVLPAELPPDAAQLALRNRLIDAGVVSPLDTHPIADAVSKELQEFLVGVGSFRPEVDRQKREVATEIAQVTSRLLGSKDVNSRTDVDGASETNWRERDAGVVEDGLRAQQRGPFPTGGCKIRLESSKTTASRPSAAI